MGIVGEIPSGSLQLEARLADKFLHLAFAVSALAQRLFVDLLKSLENLAAFGTLILVDRHCLYLPAFAMENQKL